MIIDYKDITESSGITEPVTVQECKDWLRLEGFIDDEESVSDFDDDDDFISMLINSARTRLEEYTGLSIIQKTWEVEFNNIGNFELPFSPIIEITSLVSACDTQETPTQITYTTSNNLSKLKTPVQDGLIITYDAGFTTIPEWVKNAVLAEVAYRYTHRGDEGLAGICYDATVIASPYKKVGTWLA